MSFPIHPDDMPSPRFGGWADDFNTYQEACDYYGCDGPDVFAAEAAEDLFLARVEFQDDMEARGGPLFVAALSFDEEIPF